MRAHKLRRCWAVAMTLLCLLGTVARAEAPAAAALRADPMAVFHGPATAVMRVDGNAQVFLFRAGDGDTRGHRWRTGLRAGRRQASQTGLLR